jgi:hypothetical protein
MHIAVGQVEMTIVQTHITGREKVFEIETVLREPGRLTATLVEETAPDQTGPIQLRAEIGLFGNPAREQALLGAVANRLVQLRGREWAPIR